jgi:hypothetical protein
MSALSEDWQWVEGTLGEQGECRAPHFTGDPRHLEAFELWLLLIHKNGAENICSINVYIVEMIKSDTQGSVHE